MKVLFVASEALPFMAPVGWAMWPARCPPPCASG